jgi:hypothetical protein
MLRGIHARLTLIRVVAIALPIGSMALDFANIIGRDFLHFE